MDVRTSAGRPGRGVGGVKGRDAGGAFYGATVATWTAEPCRGKVDGMPPHPRGGGGRSRPRGLVGRWIRGRKKHTPEHTPEEGNRMHEGFMAVCKGFPAWRCVPGVCGSVCFLPLYSILFHTVAHERA